MADARPGLAAVVVEAPFNLARGAERFVCIRATTAEALQVTAVEARSARGMHHVILATDDGKIPDGIEPCLATEASHDVLFAAGYGAGRLELPEGVALSIPAGRQLLVQLHLFNAGEAALAGSAGVALHHVPPAEAVQAAGILFAGTTRFRIPPGDSTQIGRCTLRAPATLVAIGPHMHALGVHQRVVLMPGDGSEERVLLDRAYDQDAQDYQLTALALAQGDVVRVECGYENGTGRPVFFGSSGADEMCYARLLVHPPPGGPIVCAE